MLILLPDNHYNDMYHRSALRIT